MHKQMATYYAAQPPPPAAPLAPGTYVSQQPMAPQVRTWSTHAALTHPPSMLTNGYAVALLTSMLCFASMSVLRPTWTREEGQGAYSLKWAAIYSVSIMFGMIALQRLANLRPGIGWVNVHTLTGAAIFTIVTALAATNRTGGSGAPAFNQGTAQAMREGVQRADEFARKADQNPDHFEAVQQAALASGHLYAFATVAGGYDKLSKATGMDAEKLRTWIDSLRQSYYAPQ